VYYIVFKNSNDFYNTLKNIGENREIAINYEQNSFAIKIIYNNITTIKDSNDNQSISFKLPQMSNSTKVVLECSNLPYQVYGILQIDNRPKMIILSHLFGNFNIKKDPLEDVYNLYALNENELVLYSTALVNDFKTSHFLKKLFSIKKDYKNIEFSDDEDTESLNKNLIYVSCIYIHEFKKWKPYVLKKGDADSTKTIQFKEKKNIAL
jgi:hypothetical protein